MGRLDRRLQDHGQERLGVVRRRKRLADERHRVPDRVRRRLGPASIFGAAEELEGRARSDQAEKQQPQPAERHVRLPPQCDHSCVARQCELVVDAARQLPVEIRLSARGRGDDDLPTDREPELHRPMALPRSVEQLRGR